MEIIIYNAYFFKNRSWKSTNQHFKKYQVLTLESGQGIRGQAINHGISVFLKGPEKTGVASLLTGFHYGTKSRALPGLKWDNILISGFLAFRIVRNNFCCLLATHLVIFLA